MFEAFVGHLVGDYLLQNDWMAKNKHSSTPICALHCGLWSVSVLLFAAWPLWTLPVLFVTHFIQDRTKIIEWYMQVTGQKEFALPPYAPWSIIIVDNTWHIVVLWAIWRFGVTAIAM